MIIYDHEWWYVAHGTIQKRSQHDAKAIAEHFENEKIENEKSRSAATLVTIPFETCSVPVEAYGCERRAILNGAHKWSRQSWVNEMHVWAQQILNKFPDPTMFVYCAYILSI